MKISPNFIKSINYKQKTFFANKSRKTNFIINELYIKINKLNDKIKKKIHKKPKKDTKYINSKYNLNKKECVVKKLLDTVESDPEKLCKMIDSLCDSNDIRFNGKDPKFKFEKDTIKKLINESKNETTKKTNQVVRVRSSPLGNEAAKSPLEKKTTEEISKKKLLKVAMNLVGLVKRNDIESDFKVEDKTTKIRQVACQVVVDGGKLKKSEENKSISSILANTEKGVKALPNTALVQTDEGEVICFRSAKTHKSYHLDQRSKIDIAARVDACKELPSANETMNALTCVDKEKNVYSYQPAIFTMMDYNPIKASLTSLSGVIKKIKQGFFGKKAEQIAIENERKFLYEMEKENIKRFEGRKHIDHQVITKNDNVITVREYPAIIQNQVFSYLSKFEHNIEKARKTNLSGQLEMLEKMVKKDKDLFENIGMDKNLLAATKKNPNKSNLKKISKKLYEAYKKDTTTPEQKMVLKAFQANLIGKSFKGKSYNKKTSAADLTMLTGIQADYFGLALSVQCKSGNDRTIVATAHKVAQKVYYKTYGSHFDPEAFLEGTKEREQYKKFYTQALIDLGFPNVEASRGPVHEDGKSGLKIKSSFVAHAYLNQFDETKAGYII